MVIDLNVIQSELEVDLIVYILIKSNKGGDLIIDYNQHPIVYSNFV